MSRFEVHSHTHYSNLRLLDCINKPKDLINRAIELGLSGIAITDHECLSSAPEINIYHQELIKEHPDFKVAIGNEIYLTNNRETKQQYYHFILIAKDKIGYRMLRELSSYSWLNSYEDRGERVPTLKSELKDKIAKYGKGHLIGTSACLGGELSTLTLQLCQGDDSAKEKINDFIIFCKDLFGDDFYCEIAPGQSKEQVMVNKRLKRIADYYNLKIVIGTDAHYLTKNDRFVHKAYLTSKDGEREVDDFYAYSYLQSKEEIIENLKPCELDYDILENNSKEIYNKIENYSILHKQQIPKVEVRNYPKGNRKGDKKYPTLTNLLYSDNEVERYWINECISELQKQDKLNDTYLSRLEEEADVKKTISEKLETNMFSYPVSLKHYIDMIWEESTVGAGRGSSCSGLNHYLLGITQLDPIEWDLPFFRYLNKERIELGDIDIDLAPSRRPAILQKIRDERGQKMSKDVDEISRKKLGCTLIATFGTESTKSAILTACRGYRSEDCPNGIDIDEAKYISSLIPQERGFVWELSDVVYGDEEKGRRPISLFIKEVEQYPGLLNIMFGIQGLIKQRGSHASGVIFFDEDPYEFGCFMKTPNGEVITQYDLHMDEACGMTKYDFLVTEVQDKIMTTIKLLQDDGLIEEDLTLKEIYNKYLHPNVLPLEDNKIWDAIGKNSVLNVFQFDSIEGNKAVKKLQPKTITELADANGLLRLMGEEGAERPIDKYYRFKNDISLWYKEMTDFGLTDEEQKYLEPYFKSSYGVPPSQEQLMRMLMDDNICHFSLGEANSARKIVGKKQMSKIPELKEKVLTQASSEKLGQYVWKYGAGPQMGYSFSVIHALAYSFIGAQTVYLATNWDPIYWNTACLIVNSGSLEDNSEEELVDIFEPEGADLAEGITFADLPDRSGKIRKTVSTDYEKMAKAIGEIIQSGINVSLIDINKSKVGFTPDTDNNSILFGLKGVLNINDALVEEIINNRPYTSIKDFVNKVKIKRPSMISLIKGGAFDKMIDRKKAMAWYIWETCKKNSGKVTMQNMSTLLKRNLVPIEEEIFKTPYRVYEFNRYLKAKCKKGEYYILDTRGIDFITSIGKEKIIDFSDNNFILSNKVWDKVYQSYMDIFRAWITNNTKVLSTKINDESFLEDWKKYAGDGNLSAWEMEVLCFYFHEHEMSNVRFGTYGIHSFKALPIEPEIESSGINRDGREWKRFKLDRIAGTCIAKNKTKSIVTLLTTDGVVNVKFRKEYFAMFDKQISEKNPDGTKTVIEKSWFKRGSMIVVSGFRSGDEFVVKKYSTTPGHELYKIDAITNNNELVLRDERYKGEAEDEI